jgi:hypothetical protein
MPSSNPARDRPNTTPRISKAIRLMPATGNSGLISRPPRRSDTSQAVPTTVGGSAITNKLAK